MSGAKDVAVSGRGGDRFLLLFGADPGGDFSFEAAAQADEACRMRGEQILVDARLVVEPLGVAGRHQLDQVVIARRFSASSTR